MQSYPATRLFIHMGKEMPMDKKDYWEVRRDGVPLAGGPKSTMPDAKQRKSLREGGCKIYVEGKLFREAKNVAP